MGSGKNCLQGVRCLVFWTTLFSGITVTTYRGLTMKVTVVLLAVFCSVCMARPEGTKPPPPPPTEAAGKRELDDEKRELVNILRSLLEERKAKGGKPPPSGPPPTTPESIGKRMGGKRPKGTGPPPPTPPDSIGKRMGGKRPKGTGPPPPTAAGKRELALLLRELLEKSRGKGGKGSKGPKPTGAGPKPTGGSDGPMPTGGSNGPKPTRPFDGPMPTDLPDVFPTQAGNRELALLLRELLEERRGKGSKGPKPTRGGPMPTGSFDGPMPTGPFDGPMPTDLPDGFFDDLMDLFPTGLPDDLMPTGSDLMFPMPTDNIGKRVGSMGGK